ncbi:tetratricopeptide repeat protein [Lentzea sp. BCCO 10_0856]|uniref:Tetratricopeptide repeat protein n=1 Tax=Lentzea miocenica TaxID=3095431 RepID=A0ABU4T3Z5_9PSEU|nr:tetratricopeptide repeat protein [Lentzea sp. BCCO 10_0856]MDX8032863.1 tetratricopeptide repeat protein [Lentzea sp. BCCO 10_0856]
MRTDLFPRPHQLPAAISDFVGREELVQSAVDLIAPFPQVVLLTGPVGTGKTTVAVHAAHQVANGFFPDGQLFVRLRGTTPYEVLGRFLASFGMSVPADFAARLSAYRDAVARQSLLFVLDDATSVGQVTPLLPHSPGCAVLVTSRHRLRLPHVVEVGALEPVQAMTLLGNQIGPARLSGNHAEALVAATDCLPLALRIAGARLAARPHWPISLLVDQLRGPRLDVLAHGGLSIRERLEETSGDLSLHARRLLGLLAALGERRLPSWAPVAAFGDVRGQSAVDELVSAHLVETDGSGYVVPALVREFAEGQASTADALRRVLGGWLYLVDHARAAVYGGEFSVVRGSSVRQVVRLDPLLRSDPLAWLESLHANLCEAVLLAAEAGLDELSWELAHRLVTLFETRTDYDGWQRTHDIALAACEAAGNLRGSAVLRCSLASLHISQSRYDTAREMTVLAKDVFEDLDDLAGLGLVYRNLGIVSRSSGELAQARQWYQRALAVYERLRDPIGHASVLQLLAQIDLYDGDPAGALSRLNAAVDVCGGVGPARVLAQINYRRGKLLAAEGRHDQAFDVLTTALDLARAARDRRGESFVLYALGRNEFARDRRGSALTLLREAAAICDTNFDVVGAARARMELSRVHLACGETQLASELEAAARAVYSEFGLKPVRGDLIFQM